MLVLVLVLEVIFCQLRAKMLIFFSSRNSDLIIFVLQYGDTILIHAVKGGHLEVVNSLLKKYVDVNVQGVVS